MQTEAMATTKTSDVQVHEEYDEGIETCETVDDDEASQIKRKHFTAESYTHVNVANVCISSAATTQPNKTKRNGNEVFIKSYLIWFFRTTSDRASAYQTSIISRENNFQIQMFFYLFLLVLLMAFLLQYYRRMYCFVVVGIFCELLFWIVNCSLVCAVNGCTERYRRSGGRSPARQ